MYETEDIVSSIKEILRRVALDAEREGWTWERGRWTTEIKNRVCALGKSQPYGFGVCGTGCTGADFGEWLYDLCWYEQDAGGLRRLPLVLESEWYPEGGFDGDFEKLLQARADLKVWIFEAKQAEDIQRIFLECAQALYHFNGAPSGDRYLLAGVGWNPRVFEFRELVKP